MSKLPVKIGTRDSPLAQWQSKQVKQLLQYKNIESELVLIKSEGDLNLTTPLYEMGVQGIFTKTLDAALLNNRIDIAVHSYKDIPTKLANGLVIAAVLKRGNPQDVLVVNRERVFTKEELSFDGIKELKNDVGESLVTTSLMNNFFSANDGNCSLCRRRQHPIQFNSMQMTEAKPFQTSCCKHSSMPLGIGYFF